ncbi:hypothetical protein OFN50_32170, partial [Escherichia coli]|nr:hypothetical protein [Escherichia coli]
LVALVSQIGWRPAIFWMTILGIFLTLLFWLIIRDNPNSISSTTLSHAKKSNLELLKTVLNNPQSWWTGLYGFCCWAPIPIFAELWGVPFL